MEKVTELKSVIAARRRYKKKSRHLALFATSPRHWREEPQVHGTVSHSTRSGRADIEDVDDAGIRDVYQKDPRNSLRLASAVLKIPISTIRKAPHDKLRLFSYKKGFSNIFCRKIILDS